MTGPAICLCLFVLSSLAYSQDDFALTPDRPKKKKKAAPSKVAVKKATPAQQAGLVQAEHFNEIPTDIRVPGEWEEIQAVIISWPYLNMDPSQVNHASMVELSQMFSDTWMQLAAAVQEECSVWIRIHSGHDSVVIKNLMRQRGTPLRNYRFFTYPGQNFWVRDYGPIGFYYSDADSIGFVDTRYSSITQDYDDNLPAMIAKQLGIKVLPTSLLYENGNLDTDGHGHAFFSSRIRRANVEKNKWSVAATFDTLRRVLNLKEMSELKELYCDGGTGHIDMFFKMLDEQTIALAAYPGIMTLPDRNIIEENFAALRTLKSVYNKPYKIFRVPLPTLENGLYENISCEQMNTDPRSYLNGLFVNKTFILPVFSNEYSGNASGDNEAVELYKKLLPGYKIVTIDSRIISVVEGGIHCITMQVPAENPIRFLLAQFPDGEMKASRSYPISAEISNKDGIKAAHVSWRKKGERGWYSYRLAGNDLRNFSGYIDGKNYAPGDTIEYFLEAESYNGKTMRKPFTAPKGYYSFTVVNPPSSSQAALLSDEGFVLGISPDPASDAATITVNVPEPQVLTLTILDFAGREVEKIISRSSMGSGTHKFTVFVTNYPTGRYFCTVSSDEEILGTKMFNVMH